MDPQNTYNYISTISTTVLLGATAFSKRATINGIFINKALAGTVTIQSNASTTPVTIGILAIGTPAGSYWYSDGGTVVMDPQFITSAADNITICYGLI